MTSLMLLLTHALNPLLMLAMPLILGAVLARRLHQRWALFGLGALIFIASQIVHIPLNYAVAQLFQRGLLPPPSDATLTWLLPLGLGLSAGLCEELARFAALRTALRRVRSWAPGLMVGAGHGGLESILLGLMVSVQYLSMLALRAAELEGFPPEVLESAEAYWSLHWAFPLVGALERAFTIPCHVAMTLLVLQSFTRDNKVWLLAAIGMHVTLDAGAVALTQRSLVWAEAWAGAFALASVWLIFRLRDPTDIASDAYEPVQPIALKRRPLTGPPGPETNRSAEERS